MAVSYPPAVSAPKYRVLLTGDQLEELLGREVLDATLRGRRATYTSLSLSTLDPEKIQSALKDRRAFDLYLLCHGGEQIRSYMHPKAMIVGLFNNYKGSLRKTGVPKMLLIGFPPLSVVKEDRQDIHLAEANKLLEVLCRGDSRIAFWFPRWMRTQIE